MIIPDVDPTIQIPEEVSAWVAERNTVFPKITFKIEIHSSRPLTAEYFEHLAKNYKKIYAFSQSYPSVSVVIFPYPHEQWFVRIIGGLDANKEISDSFFPEILKFPLPAKLRGEIANVPNFQDLEEVLDENGNPKKHLGDRR